MNAIPRKLHSKLASPFLLVHSVGHDEWTWFPLFLVCYFHHNKDGGIPRSHSQAHTMDSIAVGHSPTLNALLVYNPRTKKHYEPNSYHLDPYLLPSLVYPSLTYDGGLFCSLYQDDNSLMEERYPPGMCIEQIDPTTHMLLVGTVMDIPLHSNPTGLAMYLILFDNGTSASIPLADMASLIPSPPISGVGLHKTSSDDNSSLLPPFLQVRNCITYKHDGGNITRASLHAIPVALIFSASKLMSRRSLRTGVLTFPISLLPGLICLQRAFCFQAMLLIHLFVNCHTIHSFHLHPLPPLIQLQTL
jgi:hypothetical protein